jgi:hypothetical protein
MSYNIKQTPGLTQNVKNSIESYNKEWKSAEEIYRFTDSHQYHPVQEFDTS